MITIKATQVITYEKKIDENDLDEMQVMALTQAFIEDTQTIARVDTMEHDLLDIILAPADITESGKYTKIKVSINE